jgi:predicted dienelactone hydrolase
VLLVAIAASLAGCADDDDPAAGSTTTAAPAALIELAEPGPFPVGVTTLTLDSGPEIEVWYPAAETASGEVTYEMRDFVPEGVRAVLTADIPAGYAFDGGRDIDVADGRFPVVLFSHGFAGVRLQSTFLTSHLASYGFVVAAPQHPTRDLLAVLSGSAQRDTEQPVSELLGSLDLVVAESERAGSRFEGHVDADRVAAVGHSAGGGTAYVAADDDRIDAYVSLAAGRAGDAPPAQKPSFFVAGAVDGIVPAAESSEPAYDSAPSPSTYWEIEGAGHNGFTDFCTFGGGTGIIGVAEQSGLGGLLDSQPQLRALGEDGCIPPAAPIEQAHPIILAGVTAWLGEQLEVAGLRAVDLDETADFELAVSAASH